MHRPCPYRSLSYASFRLRIFRRIFSAPETSIQSHAFTTRETNNRFSHITTKNESAIYDPEPCNTPNATDNVHQPAPSPDGELEPDHKDHARFSPDIKSEPPSNGFTKADGYERRPSETSIKSPLQIRKQKDAQRRKLSPPSDPGPLAKNPWAVMLASPPRSCSVTRARLPTELLVQFELVRHPEFSNLWFTPTQLLDLPNSIGDGNNSTDRGKHPKSVPFIRVTKSPAVLSPIIGQRSRMYASLISNKLKHPNGPLRPADLKQLIWREDMPDLILENLRRHAVRALILAAKHSGRGDAPGALSILHIDGEPAAQQIDKSLNKLGDLENMNDGAVLVLGDQPKGAGAAKASNTNNFPETTISEHVKDGSETASSQRLGSVPDFVKLPYREASVPVFDLTNLLSEDNLTELRASYSFYQHSALFLRPFGLVTVKPLVALWKLKGYMLDMKEPPP